MMELKNMFTATSSLLEGESSGGRSGDGKTFLTPFEVEVGEALSVFALSCPDPVDRSVLLLCAFFPSNLS